MGYAEDAVKCFDYAIYLDPQNPRPTTTKAPSSCAWPVPRVHPVVDDAIRSPRIQPGLLQTRATPVHTSARRWRPSSLRQGPRAQVRLPGGREGRQAVLRILLKEGRQHEYFLPRGMTPTTDRLRVRGEYLERALEQKFEYPQGWLTKGDALMALGRARRGARVLQASRGARPGAGRGLAQHRPL